jgi:2-C-methyl-D-erythritol 4-phosphate cytidylyltransferase
VCEVNPRAKLIAIHDGARPLVTESLITNTVVSAAEKMAVAPAVKPTDTVKITDEDGMVVETIDRERAVMMQTPQVFNADLIKGALTRAAENGAVITDDCAAVEAIGMNVFVIEGDRDNIKLTTPMDMLIAEKILKDRGGDR